jgi:hypothetical protein
MVTLASTTSLSTVLKLLTGLQDAIAQTHVASSEPLAKGLHLGDQRPPLREVFRSEDVCRWCLRLDRHCDPDPLGEMYVFIQLTVI